MLLFMLFPSVGVAGVLDLEKADNRRNSDVWARLDRLSQVEELLMKGDLFQAILEVEALLEEYPDYDLAKDLKARLDSQKKVGEAQGLQKRADEANDLWRKYNEHKNAGEYSSARKDLLSIRTLYNEEGAGGSLANDLKKEMLSIEERLDNSLSPKFSKIRSDIKAASKIESSEDRLKTIIKIHETISRILGTNAGLPSAILLEQDILKELDKAARLILAKAITLKQLDGCEPALPILNNLKNILNHPALRLYGVVSEEISNCGE